MYVYLVVLICLLVIRMGMNKTAFTDSKARESVKSSTWYMRHVLYYLYICYVI